MKLTTISLLCLLSLAAYSIQEDPNPCLNPFTDRVKADPDTSVQGLALDTANTSYSGTMCSTEWSTHGTCCNKDKVIEVAEKHIKDW